MKTLRATLITLGSVSLAALLIARAYYSTQFDKEFTSLCLNAVYARDSVEAEAYMQQAVTWLETHAYDHGTTSAFSYSTGDDLALFKQRMDQRLVVLKRGRECGIDQVSVWRNFQANMLGFDSTFELWFRPIRGLPWGISVFPYNTLFVVWFIASLVLLTLGIALLVKEKLFQ